MDASGSATQFTYDATGNQVSKTDASRAVWNYSYDAGDRLLSATDPLGNVTQFAYDANGNQVATVDALGNRASATYNAFDLPLSQTDELGNVTSFEYDLVGQSTAMVDASGGRTTYQYDATGSLTAIVDALGNRSAMGYDAMGRVSATVDALGNRTTNSYDVAGRLTSQTDASGNVTLFEYDALNRQTAGVDALGHRTQIQYDALGRVVAIVDALGNQSSRTQYDALGREVAVFDALGNSTTFQYDAASRCTSQTDAKGQTTSWTYDALGRVVQNLFADGSRINYTFDAAGRQTAMQDGTGTTTTTFDALDRETSVRYGSGHTLSYVLDKLGQRTQMTDPDGGVTLYQHDASGRLTQLTNPQSETTRFVYDALDRVAQKALANGVVETHAFNDAGRETKIEYRNSAGTLLASFASAYDATGKRTSVSEADGSTTSYTYDADEQLLGETRTGSNAYSIAYAYDASGNRLTKTENGLVTSYTYDAANQLQSQETRDANGNLVSRGTASYDLNGNVMQQVEAGQVTSFSWNPQNYLVGVTHPDGTGESYTYCGEGIRRTKTGGEGFRRFIRDGQNILLEVADTGGTLRRYTHQSDGWGTLLSLHQGQISRFYGFDGIANTRLLTDENGGMSDGYLYSAFGEEHQVMGATANPLRFGGEVGYYRDEEERIYVRARHLDVGIGRWLSRDPIGFSGGVNLYSYCGGNPANRIDPNGLARIDLRWRNVAGGFNHAYLLVWDTDAHGNTIGIPRYFGGYKGDGFSSMSAIDQLTAHYDYYLGPSGNSKGSPDWGGYSGSITVVNDNNPACGYVKIFKDVAAEINDLHLMYPPSGSVGYNSNTVARSYLWGIGVEYPFTDSGYVDTPYLPNWNWVFFVKPTKYGIGLKQSYSMAMYAPDLSVLHSFWQSEIRAYKNLSNRRKNSSQ